MYTNMSEFRATVTLEDNNGFEVRYVHYCKRKTYFSENMFLEGTRLIILFLAYKLQYMRDI